MHETSIREIDPERDAPAVVRLIQESTPAAVTNVAAFLHRLRTVPERARARTWIAESDGRLVGKVDCFLSLFERSSRSAAIRLAVAETHRRRGIGSALYEAALGHAEAIGAEQLLTQFHETEAGVRFAAARGFAQVRAETESSLDPRLVAEQPPAELDLRPLTDVDPVAAYEIDMEAMADMPATETFDGVPYEEWVDHVLRHPLLVPAGSFVAFVSDDAAAVSLLTADPESGRASSMFTGTRRAHRGRGLALAVKLASIHWAAANGIDQLVTYNDATNAPMLAVNSRLGYRPTGRQVEWLNPLEGRAGTASSQAPPAPAT